MSENTPQDSVQNQQSNEFVFDEEVDITTVALLHEKLNRLLNEQKEIYLNAQKVTKIDGAGLQLIMGFILAARKLALTIKWNGVSEQFAKNAEILGLTDQLILNR